MDVQQQQPTTSRMPPVQRLFFVSLTAVAILSLGLVTIVVVSVIPHFFIIGWVATGVVIVCLVCIAIGVVAFTFSRVGLWGHQRNIVRSGEVVVYIDGSGQIKHLSAAHERAKIPQLALPSPAGDEENDEDELPMADADVIDLYNHGASERTIAEAAGMSRYQVRKVLDRNVTPDSSKKKRG
jgi:hypothetical protein